MDEKCLFFYFFGEFEKYVFNNIDKELRASLINMLSFGLYLVCTQNKRLTVSFGTTAYLSDREADPVKQK